MSREASKWKRLRVSGDVSRRESPSDGTVSACEEAFHLLPHLVLLRIIGNGLLAMAFERSDRHQLPILEVSANLVAVVSSVQHSIGQ
jgi:hypothetical protein